MILTIVTFSSLDARYLVRGFGPQTHDLTLWWLKGEINQTRIMHGVYFQRKLRRYQKISSISPPHSLQKNWIFFHTTLSRDLSGVDLGSIAALQGYILLVTYFVVSLIYFFEGHRNKSVAVGHMCVWNSHG